MAATNLPIGVVIPTLNVREKLPAHLAHAQSWLGLVRQVVIVDSYSTDGTFEYLQEHLKHPGLRILKHSRGLYQSWNYGLQQLETEFAYISTIGDTIQPEALPHLTQVLKSSGADLVVSPPELVNIEGKPVKELWPIHKLLAACPLHKPQKLNRWQTFLLSVLDSPAGMMGSSASNLYRTRTLQQLPFPSDYGHAGDSAWALRHAWEMEMAVTPHVFSRFTMHLNANTGMDDQTLRALIAKFDALVQRTAKACPADSPGVGWTLDFINECLELPVAQHALWENQAAYYRARREVRPWFVNPAAWRARAARNRSRSALLTKRRRFTEGSAMVEAFLGSDESGFEASLNRYLLGRLRQLR